jgi:hypothetical protein
MGEALKKVMGYHNHLIPIYLNPHMIFKALVREKVAIVPFTAAKLMLDKARRSVCVTDNRESL